MKNYLRYHKASGSIFSKISANEILPVESNPDYALIEGVAGQNDHWIDDGQIADREFYDAHAASAIVEQGTTALCVLSALPDPCWVRVRGAGGLAYDEQLFFVEGGSLMFAPDLAGTYVAELEGRYIGLPKRLEVISLDAFKQRRNDEVTARKAITLAAGVTWNGHRWDADTAAQLNVSGMATSINAGVPLPRDFYWTSFDNENVPMTAQDVLDLGAAIVAFNFAVHDRNRSLKAQIEMASTLSDVAAINITTGWPS